MQGELNPEGSQTRRWAASVGVSEQRNLIALEETIAVGKESHKDR